MANTYSQIYIHIVFAVEGRQNLIEPARNNELQKYVTGILTGQKQKLIAINNMPDHVHILIGLKPDMALSDLVGDIKTGSSNFINRQRWVAWAIQLAGGLRRVFLFAIAVGHRDPLHSEPAGTSLEKDIQAGIR